MSTIYTFLRKNKRKYLVVSKFLTTFAPAKANMVPVVQLVRASDCGSECRRFEPDRAPSQKLL